MSERLLEQIANGFFGYGDSDAPLWFVGYEEHCDDEEDARRRLPILASLQGAVDVMDAHRQWGTARPTNTSTWPEMQQILRACGLGSAHVGTAGSRTFLSEILPFPHASVTDYYGLYHAFAQTRRDYEAKVIRSRCKALRRSVELTSPAVVLVHRRRKNEDLLDLLAGPGSPDTTRLGTKCVDIIRRKDTTWVRSPNLSGAARWSPEQRRGLRQIIEREIHERLIAR